MRMEGTANGDEYEGGREVLSFWFLAERLAGAGRME
jgi:hypothetical protein